jgi:hypothetical protein
VLETLLVLALTVRLAAAAAEALPLAEAVMVDSWEVAVAAV